MRAAPHAGHPASGTPPRRPGSVRRTTTHDSARPGGLGAPIALTALGRDLWTDPDGRARVLDTAEVGATISADPSRVIESLSCRPATAALERLEGRPAAVGFRRALDEALPGEDRTRSLRWQLLDDLPTALLVAGYAQSVGGAPKPKGFDLSSKADICAGWASDATLLSAARSGGSVPVARGPAAPSLLAPDDPDGWHGLAPMGPHSMRRWRRIDVWLQGGAYQVEAFFRDSHMDAGGRETVVHEYTVHAEVDPSSGALRSCEADVGSLPWPECPSATASASRLAGSDPAGLRDHVRRSFTGTSTCTHLNDTLRSLAALPFLTAVVGGGGAAR